MDENKSRDSESKGHRKEKQKAAGCWSLLECGLSTVWCRGKKATYRTTTPRSLYSTLAFGSLRNPWVRTSKYEQEQTHMGCTNKCRWISWWKLGGTKNSMKTSLIGSFLLSYVVAWQPFLPIQHMAPLSSFSWRPKCWSSTHQLIMLSAFLDLAYLRAVNNKYVVLFFELLIPYW